MPSKANFTRAHRSTSANARLLVHPYKRVRDGAGPSSSTAQAPSREVQPTPCPQKAELPPPMHTESIGSDDLDGDEDTSYESAISSFAAESASSAASVAAGPAANYAPLTPVSTPFIEVLSLEVASFAASSRDDEGDPADTETRHPPAISDVGLGLVTSVHDTLESPNTSIDATENTTTDTDTDTDTNSTTADRLPGTIQSEMYPNIMDRVIGFSCVDTRLTFRQASKYMRDIVDAHFVPRHVSFRTPPSGMMSVLNFRSGKPNELFTPYFSWALVRTARESSVDRELPPGVALPDLARSNVAESTTPTTKATRSLMAANPRLFATHYELDLWNAFVSFAEVIDFDSGSLDEIVALRPVFKRFRIARVGQKDLGGSSSPSRRLKVPKAVVFASTDNFQMTVGVGSGPLMQFQADTIVINLMSFPVRFLAANICQWALPQDEPRRMVIVLHATDDPVVPVNHPMQRSWNSKHAYFHYYEKVLRFASRTLRWTRSTRVQIVGFEDIKPGWFGAPPDLCFDEIRKAALFRIREHLEMFRAPEEAIPAAMERIVFVPKDEYAESIGPKEYFLETAPCPALGGEFK